MAGDAFMLVGLAALGHAVALALTIGLYRGLRTREQRDAER